MDSQTRATEIPEKNSKKPKQKKAKRKEERRKESNLKREIRKGTLQRGRDDEMVTDAMKLKSNKPRCEQK